MTKTNPTIIIAKTGLTIGKSIVGIIISYLILFIVVPLILGLLDDYYYWMMNFETLNIIMGIIFIISKLY